MVKEKRGEGVGGGGEERGEGEWGERGGEGGGVKKKWVTKREGRRGGVEGPCFIFLLLDKSP